MAVDELRHQAELASADPQLSDTERAAVLRDLAEHADDVAGAAARYRSNRDQLQEAGASALTRDRLWARSIADLREALVRDGADPAELDEGGYLSHVELDELEEEGLLVEAVGAMQAKFNPALHLRGRSGKWAVMPEHVHGSAHQAYFAEHPSAQMIHVDRLKPTRNDSAAHIAKARGYLDEAKAGKRAKRPPIDVRDNGDGTFSIIDGNSTYAALKGELSHLPAIVHQDAATDDEAHRVANGLEKTAMKSEPKVTPTMQEATEFYGGHLEGLENRIKSHESLVRKIKAKQEKYPGMSTEDAGGRIGDVLRYTAVFPGANYTEGVQATLHALAMKGYRPWQLENYWGGRDDYNGFHANMTGLEGGKLEIQFHTPESLTVMRQQNHPIYEKFRVSKDPHERWELWQQMVENAKAMPTPPGVEKIGEPAQHQPPVQ